MAKSPSLESLRKRLDKIDVALHALLVERAEIALEVAKAKRADVAAGRSIFRPAREAELLRRLLSLPSEPLPAQTTHRIWREIIGASAWLQSPFSIAVSGGPEAQFAAAGLYGANPPIVHFETPHQVLRSLTTGKTQIGVLADPISDPWWCDLLEDGFTELKIVGRLPFLQNGDGRTGRFVIVGAIEMQGTGADQSYLGFLCTREVSAGALSAQLQKAGLAGRRIAAAPNKANAFAYLAEIDDYVGPADARLGTLASVMGRTCLQIMALGACPNPILIGSAKG